MPPSSREHDSRRELEQIVEQCRALATRVRAKGALAKCLGTGDSFFSPAQQAADRIEQGAQIVEQFFAEGPDKDAKVVSNCVNRLIRTMGFGDEKPASKEHRYDPGEFTGHSRAISVPEMLEFLSLMNKTGVLEVATKTEHFTLELEAGEIVHASSSSAPPEERLGAILVRQGSLTESKLHEFLKRHKGTGKLGKALESGKVITPEALGQALSHQIQQLFTRLFTSKEAYYIFREGAPQNDDTGLRMNVTGLLLESASSIDEEGHDAELRAEAEKRDSEEEAETAA